ncbi:MAG: 16S rRNA (adenine(1518)-N(6)/adenine(1519)-N(6))-dimethyltransferase RsmA [Patescibacteria group bacterium]|jgi:16S rRNA (adenine1518-N6/adenine1519-N6)-dimethyltransferase
MNPTQIKAALTELGGSANKRLGQHFLIDQNVLGRIVDTAAIKKGDRVLEVGPGLGVLTRALLDRGAEVIAIEQDRRFIERLSDPNLRVVHGDAAAIHWHELVDDRPWKFVSNLPYSMTSLALRKALWSPKPPQEVVVLIQREVAERCIARDGKTSLLSLMVALASESSRIVTRVARGAFYPPPKVESAVLHVVPMSVNDREKKWGMNPEKVMDVARKGFAHPRKLLSSNLEIDPSVLGNLGLNPKARAEDLAPEAWARLASVVVSLEL